MSRGGHPSIGKRQRQAEKARKKREKLERRMQKRDEPTQPIPITTADTIVGNLPPIEDAMDAIHQELDPSFVPEGAEEGEVAAPTGQPTRLFVGRLSWDTDSDGLREAFGEIGPVMDAVVVLDRDTGKSRGFGFVTMGDRKSAKRAIDELGDSELDGRNIVVSFATER